MRYRREDLNKLNNDLKIEEVVGEFVDLKRVGSSYKGLCPFHADTNPSFMVTPSKNICKCFSCGAGGGPIKFYSMYKNISYTEAAGELAKKYGYTLRGIVKDDEKERERERYYEIMDVAHKFFMKNIFELGGRPALEYFSKRQVTSDIINQNALGYAGSKRAALYNYMLSKDYSAEELLKLGLIKQTDDGNYYDAFRNRIIFPIYSQYGRVIAFGGRSLENSKDIPKYINSPDTPIFKKGYNLYGVERIRSIKERDYAILMEGYMDVLSACTYGFDTALAPLGTALTEEQVVLLGKYTKNVLLCFDMDSAGLIATERAAFILKRNGFQVRVLRLENSKDPDEFLKKYGRDEFLAAVRESKEIFDFLYSIYVESYNLSDNISRQKFIERFKDFFENLSTFEQSNYISTFSKRVGIDADALKSLLISKTKKQYKKTYEEIVEEAKSEANIPSYIKNIYTYNFEMTLINYIMLKPHMYHIFKGEEMEEHIPKKIFKYFLPDNLLKNKKIKKENENIDSNILIDEFNSFLKKTDKFNEEEKQMCRNDILMSSIENATIFNKHIEEMQLFKSYLNYKLKKYLVGQEQDISKLLKIKQLEMKAKKAKHLDDFLLAFEELKEYL